MKKDLFLLHCLFLRPAHLLVLHLLDSKPGEESSEEVNFRRVWFISFREPVANH